MQPHLSVFDQARDFLSRRTFALVGVSRNSKDYSRWLMRKLQSNGRIIFAVNPNCEEIDGVWCYKSVVDIPATVDGAILMVPESLLPRAIGECIQAGISRIWIYGVGHPRKLDEDTKTFCDQHRVQIINGLCPMMCLADTAWPHHLHGWIAGHSRAYRRPAA